MRAFKKLYNKSQKAFEDDLEDDDLRDIFTMIKNYDYTIIMFV